MLQFNHTRKYARGDRILDAIYSGNQTYHRIWQALENEFRPKAGHYMLSVDLKRLLMGYRAKQVILDFAFVKLIEDMVDSILRNSCVPKSFRLLTIEKFEWDAFDHIDILRVNI